MSFELWAVFAGLVALLAQVTGILTTNKLKALGGIEKNKLMARFQDALGPKLWGPATLLIIVIVLAVPWAIWGPRATIVIAWPLILFSIIVAVRNRKWIRRREAILNAPR